MTAKEYLQKIKRTRERIQSLEEQRAHIMSTIGIKAIDYTADRIRSSSDGDRMISAIARCVKIDNEIWQEKEHYIAQYRKVMKQIDGLDDSRYAELLKLRYIDDKRLEDIACIMRRTDGSTYSFDHILHMHGWALASFTEKYAKDIE